MTKPTIPNCIRANVDALIDFHEAQGHTGTFLLSSEPPEAEGIPAKGTLVAVLSGTPAQLMAIQQFLGVTPL